jgi:tetratricopeptide (TPR) repeat protein
MMLFDQGEAVGAQADWETAQRLNPQESASFSPDRARIFAKDWRWAEAYFLWLERHGAEKSILTVSRGEVALRAGQFERAAMDFEAAQKRYPPLRDLCYYHGIANQEMGRFKDAGLDYRRAMQVSRRKHIRRLAALRLKQVDEELIHS